METVRIVGGDFIKNNKLREAREGKGLSLEDMAERLGITKTTYYNYESNQRSIPVDMAERIAAILNIKYNDIFLPSRVTIRRQRA